MPIDERATYNALLTAPERFLTEHYVTAGGSPQPSGIQDFCLREDDNARAFLRPGSFMKTLNAHPTDGVRLDTSTVANGQGQLFQAHSVHMDAGAQNLNFYTLDAETGPSVMVTGQLTGCSFVMRETANGLEVAHVSPGPGQTGQQLHTALADTHPNVYGAAGTSGNYDSQDRSVTVVGVRANGKWRIFAQKQVRAALAQGNKEIKSVYQIFPERKKLS